jgi:hypothetical protein
MSELSNDKPQTFRELLLARSLQPRRTIAERERAWDREVSRIAARNTALQAQVDWDAAEPRGERRVSEGVLQEAWDRRREEELAPRQWRADFTPADQQELRQIYQQLAQRQAQVAAGGDLYIPTTPRPTLPEETPAPVAPAVSEAGSGMRIHTTGEL